MSGEWRVTSNFIGGKKKFAVYRLRDAGSVDHSGNREYASEYIDSPIEAITLAAKLNAQEGEIIA